MGRDSNLKTVFLFMVLPVFLLLGSIAHAQRAIPADNLAYPVLITLPGVGTGSGFYIHAKTYVYLVTAKHVLFNPQNQLLATRLELRSYSPDPDDNTPNVVFVDLAALRSSDNSNNIKISQTADVAVVRLFVKPKEDLPGEPKGKIDVLTGVSVESFANKGLLTAPLESIATFDKVFPGNDIILFGFPSSLALAQVGQLDPNRPLLRKGIVAGTIPAKKSIVLDCPSYFGNSGGPVVELIPIGLGSSQLRIIGVIDQFVPFVQAAGSQTFMMQFNSNSGYSIAIPMDFVLEMIDDK